MSLSPYTLYGVSEETASLAKAADEAVSSVYDRIDEVKTFNQLRILEVFRKHKFSEVHFGSTTGYGYDDIGREKLEAMFAEIFGAEAGYVRMQISSGTQAISSMLYGLLRPGDGLLSVTGRPYDTLASTIGLTEETYDGSLLNFGITYDEVELGSDGTPDLEAIRSKISDKTKVVFIQKSRGYTGRRALLCEDIKAVADLVKSVRSDIIVAVDNCYGEFTEKQEPCAVGADICAGSLIKNPGGGICTTGGYVVGRKDLVEKVAQRITAPGLGSHVGPTLGFNSRIAQGIFMAPHVVAECLKGAVFAAKMFEMSGLSTSPSSEEVRGDIVQTITFNDDKKLVDFCGKIQACSPVDSFVTPEPWAMPGYEDQVVMAAGTFVQGATTELSCDGPVKPPYIAYMQGGLVREQARLAVMLALSDS
ncbi:Cystathionine beta-lyase family protein involved in aluminum resistance [Oscillospiraceae bacterium]|nr:Cystathionine beta-lyase family protein involved in aluminum resistance [Oscillospiraceae bacterium]